MSSKRNQSATWQQSLAKAREMRGQSGGALFDRMQLLVAVFEDQEWRERTAKTSEDQWLDMLDEEVSDVFLTFGELRDMIGYAPERSQWTTGRLDVLRAKMIEERRSQRQTEVDRPASKRVTREEFQELAKEKAQVETKAAYLDGEFKSIQERYRDLEQENRRLQRELATAEGRISELERMVKREFANA